MAHGKHGPRGSVNPTNRKGQAKKHGDPNACPVCKKGQHCSGHAPDVSQEGRCAVVGLSSSVVSAFSRSGLNLRIWGY